jgi:hypothetical protein
MNNPCEQCIVNAMCKEHCQPLVEYICFKYGCLWVSSEEIAYRYKLGTLILTKDGFHDISSERFCSSGGKVRI